jgi:dolichol kinase
VQYIVLAYTGFMTGDAAAALIGTKLGRIRIRGSKTLEGSLAFLAASVLSTAWIMPGRWILLFLSAAGLTLAELVLTRVDDNFYAPLLLTLAFVLLL